MGEEHLVNISRCREKAPSEHPHITPQPEFLRLWTVVRWCRLAIQSCVISSRSLFFWEAGGKDRGIATKYGEKKKETERQRFKGQASRWKPELADNYMAVRDRKTQVSNNSLHDRYFNRASTTTMGTPGAWYTFASVRPARSNKCAKSLTVRSRPPNVIIVRSM